MMCTQCEERCAKAVYEKAIELIGKEPLAWGEKQCTEIARAVREAGRLSECPEAVERLLDEIPRWVLYHNDKPRGENRERPKTVLVDALRATEDAAMGKATTRSNASRGGMQPEGYHRVGADGKEEKE